MSEQKQPKVRFSGFDDAWEQRKLDKVAEYRNGKGHEKSISSNGKYIVVNSKFVSTNGLVKKFTNIQMEPLVKGDIAFVLSDVPNGRALARTFLISKNNKYSLNQRIAGITPKNNISSFFLSSLMNRSPYFLKFDDGVSQTNLSKKDVENFAEMYPEFFEQKKISALLKSIDNLLAANQRQLEELKTIKKLAMQKIFDQEWRFNGFTDAWEPRKLGNVAIIKGRLGWKSLKQDEYTTNKEDPAMIAGRHINFGQINWNAVDHIPMWRYKESLEIALQDGDVIFSKDGSLGNPALIKALDGKATINSTMMLVRTNNTIYSDFFYQLMKGKQFKKLVYLKVSGSSIPHLFQDDMKKFVFSTPDIREQKRIGLFLGKLDNLIAANQSKSEQLKKLKKWFMQNMFM